MRAAIDLSGRRRPRVLLAWALALLAACATRGPEALGPRVPLGALVRAWRAGEVAVVDARGDGAFLGWPLMLLTLVLASFAGSIVGIALLASGKGTMQAALPFGTFLALGALVAAVAGEPMLSWYLSFY